MGGVPFLPPDSGFDNLFRYWDFLLWLLRSQVRKSVCLLIPADVAMGWYPEQCDLVIKFPDLLLDLVEMVVAVFPIVAL